MDQPAPNPTPSSEPTSEHGLKRELHLTDLVLMQILLIVGLGWVGFAGELGSTHVVLWMAAIAFFYLPLGAVVIHLSRALPIEGGAYQWVKAGLSPFAGYMAAWNNSFYTIFVFGVFGPTLVDSAAYIAGPSGTWMMNSHPLILGSAIAALLAVFAINVRGLHLGKWLTGFGSFLTLVLVAVLAYLLVVRWLHGPAFVHAPFSLAVPTFSILTLNVFAKMAIGALSGFDSTSVFAGECHNPNRDLPLSVMISGPSIAAAYILGTGAMLAYIPQGSIDLAAPLQQVVHAGFGNSGVGELLTSVTVLALLLNVFAGAVAMIAMTARFPMVIGWDGLLPEWTTRLHPRFKTPVRALAAVVGGCILVAIVSSWGAGGQEIIQVGTNAAVGSLCVMYATLFCVPLLGKPLAGRRRGVALRLAALAGLLVSLISLPFQIVPLTGVANRTVFGLKVAGLILAVNALGAWLYWRGSRNIEGRRMGSHEASK